LASSGVTGVGIATQSSALIIKRYRKPVILRYYYIVKGVRPLALCCLLFLVVVKDFMPVNNDFASNVRPFKPRKLTGPDTTEWMPRVLAATAYLALGYCFRIPSEGHINILMLLGLLYWGLIQQRRQAVPFFLRFHLIQGLVLFLILTIGYQVLFSVIRLVQSVVLVAGLGSLLNAGISLSLIGAQRGSIVITAGLGVVLGVMALLGKSLPLPVVTQQAKLWA
jgi:hypothetical protein